MNGFRTGQLMRDWRKVKPLKRVYTAEHVMAAFCVGVLVMALLIAVMR